MKKLILLMVVCLIFLTGCAKLEMNYVFEEDGNVSVSYIFGVQDNNRTDETNRLIDAALMQANDNGFTTTAYNDKGFIGFKAEKTISGVDYKTAGNEMMGFGEMPSIYKSFAWHYTPEIFQNKYQLKLNVNLNDIINIKDLDALPSDMRAKALDAINRSEVIIHITLPGNSVSNNADDIKSLTLTGKNSVKYTWKLSPGQTKTLMIDSVLEKNKTRDMVFTAAAAAAALIILILILFIIKSYRKNRKPVAH